jgi:branched-chain amino acid transport system ATP-binding protein
MSPKPLLRLENVAKRFGGFRALDGVSFTLNAGEVLGLVGPNGSGKTTCINVISGVYSPDGGEIQFAGRPIGGMASHRIVHLGVNRTFQVPRPFRALSVRENVEVAIAYGGRPGRDVGAEVHADHVDVDKLLRQVELLELASKPAAQLNSTQQKMLDLARALATQPKLLLIDELAAGLNPTELDRIGEKLKELARSGIALLVVEHLMRFIDQITDRIIVMNAGREIFEGVLAQAAKDSQVVEVFLGGENAAA